jgi:hypothetical protein
MGSPASTSGVNSDNVGTPVTSELLAPLGEHLLSNH